MGIISLRGRFGVIAGYTPATDVTAQAGINLGMTGISDATDGTDAGYAAAIDGFHRHLMLVYTRSANNHLGGGFNALAIAGHDAQSWLRSSGSRFSIINRLLINALIIGFFILALTRKISRSGLPWLARREIFGRHAQRGLPILARPLRKTWG